MENRIDNQIEQDLNDENLSEVVGGGLTVEHDEGSTNTTKNWLIGLGVVAGLAGAAAVAYIGYKAYRSYKTTESLFEEKGSNTYYSDILRRKPSKEAPRPPVEKSKILDPWWGEEGDI